MSIFSIMELVDDIPVISSQNKNKVLNGTNPGAKLWVKPTPGTPFYKALANYVIARE